MSAHGDSSTDLSIPSDLGEARLLQSRIEGALQASGYTDQEVFAVRLAVEEALVNAIKYGNQMDPDKRVGVSYRVTGERFDIRITGEGPDPTPDKFIDRPRGQVLQLIRGSTDGVVSRGSGDMPPLTDPDARPLYPFQGHHFTRPAGKLHYLDEGTGDPVVMLHGNPTWSFYYRNLVLALRDQYRCVVPDHIGCGLSDKPPESLYDYSLKSRIDDLEALLDHLGLRENLTLVVHDWGGMIGMGFAARHPERVKRLVVSNTGAFPLPKSKPFPWSLWLGRNTRLGAWLILKRNAFCRAAANWCVTRTPLPADVRWMYLAPYDTPEHRVAVLKFVQTIPLKPSDPGYDIVSDTAASLAKFRGVPTLLLWGMRDFVFDRHFLAEWQRHFPHAETHTWPDCGHYLLEDAGDEAIPKVRDFLTRQSR